MKLIKMKELLEGTLQHTLNENEINREFTYGFSTDLMSDALAMIFDQSNVTVLITGLANSQTLRTAEMLDIDTIILVRGKKLDHDMFELVRELNMNLITTNYSMFEVCGILFEHGLKPIRR